MEFKHKSVLLEETVDSLNVKPGGIYVDGTLGGGGHSLEICKRLNGQGRLIGIDQDQDAINAATKRLEEYKDLVTIVRSNYEEIADVLRSLDIESVDGIVLDLGVSSYQLDDAERGFSYMADAPLDMRMDQRNSKTAKDIVNEYSEMELYRVIRDYGEDKFAKNIAKNIVKAREEKEIETTFELRDIIEKSIPKKFKVKGGHPAKRTFQAIRIEVNNEIKPLYNTVIDCIDLLKTGGRLCILTFHSLEDRAVKLAFNDSVGKCTCPPGLPYCVCGAEQKAKGRIITKKPILPSIEEMENNSRSKSAKLRIFEKK